jgi:hypothetical protein
VRYRRGRSHRGDRAADPLQVRTAFVSPRSVVIAKPGQGKGPVPLGAPGLAKEGRVRLADAPPRAGPRAPFGRIAECVDHAFDAPFGSCRARTARARHGGRSDDGNRKEVRPFDDSADPPRRTSPGRVEATSRRSRRERRRRAPIAS